MSKHHHSTDYEMRSSKASIRNRLDIALMSMSFTILTLLATLKPIVLSSNNLLSFQLVMSIPLFTCALLSRSKIAYKKEFESWDLLSYFCFTLGYGFLINVVGIFLSMLIPMFIVVAFFAVNMMFSLIRSAINIRYEPGNLNQQIFRDTFYFLLTIFMGLLPAMGYY